MVQVINKPTLSSMFGSAVGAGLNQGISNQLQQLSALKAQDLMQRRTNKVFENFGFSPEEAALISQIPEKNRWQAILALSQGQPNTAPDLSRQMNPMQQIQEVAAQEPIVQQQQQQQPEYLNKVRQLFENLSKGSPISELPQQLAQIQAPQQQAAPAVQPPQQQQPAIQAAAPAPAPKPLTPRQRLAGIAPVQPKQTPAQLKHADTLRSQADNLREFHDTAQRMLNALNQGNVNYGIIAGLKSKYAPSYLDETTEQFDQESARLVNLVSQEIKGVPSKYRVSLIEREKPGVHHSPVTNKKILERYIKNSAGKLSQLEKDYPDVFANTEKITQRPEQTFNSFDQLPNVPEGSIVEDEESGERFVKRGSQWQPLK